MEAHSATTAKPVQSIAIRAIDRYAERSMCGAEVYEVHAAPGRNDIGPEGSWSREVAHVNTRIATDRVHVRQMGSGSS